LLHAGHLHVWKGVFQLDWAVGHVEIKFSERHRGFACFHMKP